MVKHFTQYDTYPWIVFSEDEPIEKVPNRLELRTDGPWWIQRPSGWWHFAVEVNILVVLFDPQNIYLMPEVLGNLVKYASQTISFDGGCMRPMYDYRRTLQINNYGIIDKDEKIEQATVEVRYKGDLKGEG